MDVEFSDEEKAKIVDIISKLAAVRPRTAGESDVNHAASLIDDVIAYAKRAGI